MALDVLDVLRLEVEDDPVGLVNLVQNPNGDLGGWGWLTPVADSTLRFSGPPPVGPGPGRHLVFLSPAAAVPSWWTSESLPVAAGQYVAARWTSPWVENYYRARIEWLKADGSANGSTAQTGYLQGSGVQSIAAIVAPALTAYCRLRFDLYSNNAGANPAGRSYMYFKSVTVAKAATAAALAGLGYIEPTPYLNVLGPTHDLSITRDELEVGLLTATILDATLDPAKADLLRPGRRVRVMALDPATSTWTPLFRGKARNAAVTYDYKSPGTPAAKRARIALTAADDVSMLAAAPRAEGVATIDNLRYLLEGAGVPWNVNGSGNQIGGATVVARNPNASLLDQIAITRDSVRGYAWVDRRGVVNVFDAAKLPAASVATFDEDDYTDLAIDYDTERCINTVTLKYLRLNLATGETVEVPYGPYVDQASIDRWGPRSAEFTVQGIVESSANMAAYAAAVLAANATPAIRANSVALAVRSPAEVAYALRDLYDLVTVNNTAAELAQALRITGVEHKITAGTKRGKWVTSYAFAANGGVAPPQPTPSPSPPVGAAQPGVWQTYVPVTTGITLGAGGTVVGLFTRIGNTIHWRVIVTLGAGGQVTTAPSISLPVTAASPVMGEASGLFIDSGSTAYQSAVQYGSNVVGMYVLAASGVYSAVGGATPFTWTANDQVIVAGTYEAAS